MEEPAVATPTGDPTRPLRLPRLGGRGAGNNPPSLTLAAPPDEQEDALATSYRRLSDVFHDLLSEQSLDALLDRIFDAVSDLVPCDTLTIYQADEARRLLVPLTARDCWAEEIMDSNLPFGQGITGWAVENGEPALINQAHLDPRLDVVPGTPADEQESLIVVPLVSRGVIMGALNVYRLGEHASFSEREFELVQRCGDAAALALDNAQIREQLERQAQTDSLTGLYNHRFFHERLRAELNRSSRAHESLAVVMLDIDDFKKVNDVFGHGTGDQILVALAGVLASSIRTADIVCRIGGEEFAVIMPACTAADSRGFAQRVTQRLATTEFEGAGRITVSVGVSQGPEDAMNPRELVAYAETAMMTAKTRGKNAVVLFDELTDGRPVVHQPGRQDVRSIAHLKMLQSLAGKLNRLNDVTRIGEVIVSELRGLIDYHACRVYVTEEEDLTPIAFDGDGEYRDETVEELACKVGEGITGRVAETGESVLLANALDCDFAVQILGTDDIDESIVAVPLQYGARTTGVILLSKLGTSQFDQDDVRFLEVLGGHASVALENARLYEAQRREAESARESAEIANALLEFSRELAAAEGLDAVLDRLVGLSTKILGSSLTSVWTQEPETGDIVVRALWGYDDAERGAITGLKLSPDVAAHFLAQEEPFILTPEQARLLAGVTRGQEGRLFAVAPIQIEPTRKGFLVSVVTEAGKPRFSERKMRLLAGVAHQAKLAITNAMSFESLEQTFLSTVEALANALEANDEYTSSHARAITDMALEVGTQLGLDPKSLKRLELGALFHDIGKIGIPSEVLLNPGPLRPDERKLIEQHPELGERILAPIVRLADVRPIVRHCHERFDGSGYPDGLAAEAIPLESRIILVCDAFHAMTTDRPYRSRLPLEEACKRLRDGAGTQFDPDVVGVFLDVLSGKLKTASPPL